MWRRRRVRLIALLLVLLGAGGGYWLTHRSPDAVLRTIALSGAQAGFASLDEEGGRLYFLVNGAGPPLTILDTRTGDPVQLHGALGTAMGAPLVDDRSGHYFDVGPQPGQFLMVDWRTGATLRSIPVPWQPGTLIMPTLEARRDRVLVAHSGAPDITVIDGRDGAILRTVQGCRAASWPVLSEATQRLVVPCAAGSLLLFDSRTYRRLGSVASSAVGLSPGCGVVVRGPWFGCDIIVDEATRRLFIPAGKGLAALDAATGAPVNVVQMASWARGSLDVLPGSHDVVAIPYGARWAGAPARAVLVLDGRSSAIQQRWPVPENPTAVLVNPLTGHVLVASAGPLDATGAPLGNGTVSVLDAQTGRTLRSAPVGILPGALLADRRARHLFVVNLTAQMEGFPLSRSYPDGWWPQLLRNLKSWAGWLPFTAPAAPTPPLNATMTMLDLTKL
jgi:hypothetical protein